MIKTLFPEHVENNNNANDSVSLIVNKIIYWSESKLPIQRWTVLTLTDGDPLGWARKLCL